MEQDPWVYIRTCPISLRLALARTELKKYLCKDVIGIISQFAISQHEYVVNRVCNQPHDCEWEQCSSDYCDFCDSVSPNHSRKYLTVNKIDFSLQVCNKRHAYISRHEPDGSSWGCYFHTCDDWNNSDLRWIIGSPWNWNTWTRLLD